MITRYYCEVRNVDAAAADDDDDNDNNNNNNNTLGANKLDPDVTIIPARIRRISYQISGWPPTLRIFAYFFGLLCP
jgi:hypothetical protein